MWIFFLVGLGVILYFSVGMTLNSGVSFLKGYCTKGLDHHGFQINQDGFEEGASVIFWPLFVPIRAGIWLNYIFMEKGSAAGRAKADRENQLQIENTNLQKEIEKLLA
jgi:hypothetical protein